MTIKLGVVMDPIENINYKKDSTLAMLWAAQDKGWELFYIEQEQLFIQLMERHGPSRKEKFAVKRVKV